MYSLYDPDADADADANSRWNNEPDIIWTDVLYFR